MTPAGAWLPGMRYTYVTWSRADRRQEARARARERGVIARMTDPELAAYLGMQAHVCPGSWTGRVFYRAARHEAVTVRGAAGIPRL
jgi:hypothetical protein